MKKITCLILALLPLLHYGQYCETFELTLEGDLELGCTNNTVTAQHDQMGRSFLYTANTQAGLNVVDISDPTSMVTAASLTAPDFDNLAVNRITQVGDMLYLALGSMFGAHDQLSGLAIVDISNPLVPEVTDVWSSAEAGGSAHVGIQGDLAYLCGLSNGVIVLDISDNENISFISQFIPPTDWPEGTDLDKIKARHIVFNEDIAYVTYGGGGLRILDISNPASLTEIGRFSNPALDGASRAYNNSILQDNLLYVAVDYAGMEVLDISNPEDVILYGWWNPNDLPLASPPATSAVWFSSHWHTNEIEIIEECGVIFMSCGRTEVVGIDISNPAIPELCGSFGDPDDNLSSYGMTLYDDKLYIGMICTFGIPFPGSWSGVKSLIYDSACPLGITDETDKKDILVYPNPTHQFVHIEGEQIERICLYNQIGEKVLSINKALTGSISLDLSTLNSGVYILKTTLLNEEEIIEKINLIK